MTRTEELGEKLKGIIADAMLGDFDEDDLDTLTNRALQAFEQWCKDNGVYQVLEAFKSGIKEIEID